MQEASAASGEPATEDLQLILHQNWRSLESMPSDVRAVFQQLEGTAGGPRPPKLPRTGLRYSVTWKREELWRTETP